ncbi:MAG: NAD(P)/FAD-dependent oxidoreductase [Actinomycetota bacterium]
MADVDLLVLGGGAGGLAAARAARWEDASAALISDAPLGGDCTWTGCVPSKTLIEASRDGSSFAEALKRVAEVTERIGSTENAEVLRSEGVDVIEGRGTFTGPRTIRVGDRTISGRNVIVATGSRPAIPPIPGLDEVPYLTNEDFFDQAALPESLIIIGGGPIGVELGEAMQRFGTQVTILEYFDRILNNNESEASELVARSLQDRGVELITEARGKHVRHEDGRFIFELECGRVLEADQLLVAAGRSPNTEGMGLDVAGVDLGERGYITTDNYLRTSAKRVFAVGDVNGKQMLSHAADEMGRVAAWTALRPGRRYAFKPERIPSVVFTTPELASIGILESDAPDNARIAEAPMHINDRALVADEPEGFVRMIAKRDWLTGHAAGGKLIGATIVGGRAGELINECALVMRSNTYAGRLAQTVRAYPSWSTVMQKTAARWFFDVEGQGARPPRKP